jgi:hypothetical protein
MPSNILPEPSRAGVSPTTLFLQLFKHENLSLSSFCAELLLIYLTISFFFNLHSADVSLFVLMQTDQVYIFSGEM